MKYIGIFIAQIVLFQFILTVSILNRMDKAEESIEILKSQRIEDKAQFEQMIIQSSVPQESFYPPEFMIDESKLKLPLK